MGKVWLKWIGKDWKKNKEKKRHRNTISNDIIEERLNSNIDTVIIHIIMITLK
jgi:hypothetical protein